VTLFYQSPSDINLSMNPVLLALLSIPDPEMNRWMQSILCTLQAYTQGGSILEWIRSVVVQLNNTEDEPLLNISNNFPNS